MQGLKVTFQGRWPLPLVSSAICYDLAEFLLVHGLSRELLDIEFEESRDAFDAVKDPELRRVLAKVSHHTVLDVGGKRIGEIVNFEQEGSLLLDHWEGEVRTTLKIPSDWFGEIDDQGRLHLNCPFNSAWIIPPPL